MIRYRRLSVFVLLTAALAAIFAVPAPAQEKLINELFNKDFYLAVNLHADRGSSRLSSVNYQVVGTLIPWGTPVKLYEKPGGMTGNVLILKDLKAQKEHEFDFHARTLRHTSKYEYFKRLFTEDIAALQQEVDRLSEKDKQGIQKGIALKGMSKRGIAIALGHPPNFENPAPDSATAWHYWFSRKETFDVIFDQNGHVDAIQGHYKIYDN